jgi:hypothetical protein
MNDDAGICPECHRDIEEHDQTDDGDGYWCRETFVPDDAVLSGADARSVLRDDAEDERLHFADL